MWLDCTVGQRVYLKVTTTKAVDAAHPRTRVPADPTTLTVTVVSPAGAPVNHVWPAGDGVIVRDGVGAFHLEPVVDAAGKWEFSSVAAGNVAASGDGQINVRALRTG